MSIPELHSRAVDEFDALVKLVKEDQWDLPTPCPEWDVRTLVNHIVYEDRWTPPLMKGQTIEQVGDRFEGDLLGDDPAGAWEEAAAEARAAVSEPGVMTRIVHLSFGDRPGEEYAGQLFTDHLIHAWDLARAIGADDSLDPELVAACYELTKPMEQMLKDSGACGPKIDAPEDANLQTKLLAVMGRRP